MKKIRLFLMVSLVAMLASGQLYSVTRLYDRATGDIIDADKDDAEFDNTNSAITAHEASTSAHGVTGTIVGTAGSQTLTNKSLTSPIITNSPTAAGATWVDLGTATAFVATSATMNALTANVLVATSSTLSTVDIRGGAINSTIIGANNPSTATFTTATITNAVVTTFNGAPRQVGAYNLELVRATTSATGDSLKVQCGGTSCSSSNPGFVVMNGTTAGTLTKFTVTSDVTIKLTGAHFGFGGKGDITGELIRGLFVNDNGTLRTCYGYLGGRDTVVTTDTTATATSATTPESLLCDTAVGSSTNTVLDWSFARADFDDTGGSSEDLHIVQSGIDDVVTGKTADGLWQPWNPTLAGFSLTPTVTLARWSQQGLTVCIQTDITANGTSNAGTYTMTAPVKAKGVQGGIALQPVDNSSNGGQPAGWRTVDDSTTLNIYRTSNDDSWTSSGTKNAEPVGCYDAMP